MRTFFISLVGICLYALTISSAYAGLAHSSKGSGAGLACAQCHVMHGTQGGNYYLSYESLTVPPPKLLMMSNAALLCLFCHENNSAGLAVAPPDVKFNALDYTPSAGDFEHNGIPNDANRHNIGSLLAGADPPPGFNSTITGGITWAAFITAKEGGATATFVCTFCHAQHGSENYRNLWYDPVNPARNNTVHVDATRIPFEMDGDGTCSGDLVGGTGACDVYNSTTGGASANHKPYDRNNVLFGVDTTDSQVGNRISRWCGNCHGDFYSESGVLNGGVLDAANIGDGDTNFDAASPWTRHPVGDIELGFGTNGHGDWTNLSATAGARFANGPIAAIDGDEQPFCLSCHYAHGGGNHAGAGEVNHSNLVLTDGAGKVNVDPTYVYATGMLRNTCNSCHNQ